MVKKRELLKSLGSTTNLILSICFLYTLIEGQFLLARTFSTKRCIIYILLIRLKSCCFI